MTDADIVYLTVDLNGTTAATRLNEAKVDIKAGNLKAADVQLAKLTEKWLRSMTKRRCRSTKPAATLRWRATSFPPTIILVPVMP